MEDRGEVCLEEEVARLHEAGMEADEIASRMGVDVAWVETLVSMWEPEDG